MMFVLFRADASVDIGTGHVMRCLTLAERLRQNGARVAFLCRQLQGDMCGYLAQRGLDVQRLPLPENPVGASREDGKAVGRDTYNRWLGVPQARDASETRQAVSRLGHRPDWLVVDHYALDAGWERELRPDVGRIMVIDDLTDREHDCDLLLDQNLRDPDAPHYAGLVPRGCRLLLGPRYALLRPEFQAARARLRDRHGPARRVLVFFGGIDATNQTDKVLKAFELLRRDDLIADVVTSSRNPRADQIREQCRKMKNVHFHGDVGDMAGLMSEADLSIGAGGTAVWERCALKLPTLAWPVAENQSEQLHMLARNGAVCFPDPASIQEPDGLAVHINALLNNGHLRRDISRRAGELCDAGGTNRVVGNLTQRIVTVRRAAAGDCKPVHEWRNHPDVRQYALNAEEIPWERHKAWFESAIADPRTDFLIVEENRQPVGVVRFDIAGEIAGISIYVVPGMHGQGYGHAVLDAALAWLRGQRPEIRDLSAKIARANGASMRLFEGAGFERIYGVYRKRVA